MTRVVLVFALVACSDSSTPSESSEPLGPSQPAPFRGYEAVERDVRGALIDPGAPFELHAYLGEGGASLATLLGGHEGFGVKYNLVNAAPNAMNTMIWRMLFAPLANDLAALCPGSARDAGALVLGERAAAVAAALCAWPVVSDGDLAAAWDLVMGYRAPAGEREAWIAYARLLADRSADEALPSVWLGILLHPAYLLER